MRKIIIINILILSGITGVSQTKSLDTGKQFTRKNITYIPSEDSNENSLAVIVDEVPLAHTTQFYPVNKNGKLVGEGNLSNQVNQVLKNLTIALKTAESKFEDIIKLNICIANSDIKQAVQHQLNKKFSSDKRPSISFVVGKIALSNALLAVDAVAVSKTSINKSVNYFRSEELFGDKRTAHVSVLPAKGVVYISGQADKGELAEATRGTLKQLEETLKYLDLEKKDVVQIKAFVCPATDYKVVENEVSVFFKGLTIPPVIFVDWDSKSPVVEIEMITASGKSKNANKQLEFITPTGMKPSPVYSKVSRINYGKKIYISSLYGQHTEGANKEITDIFNSLTDILKKSGSDLNHLAKATYYVSDAEASAKLNELRPKYYHPDSPPAASKATVEGVGISGKGISIDMIGVVTDKTKDN